MKRTHKIEVDWKKKRKNYVLLDFVDISSKLLFFVWIFFPGSRNYFSPQLWGSRIFLLGRVFNFSHFPRNFFWNKRFLFFNSKNDSWNTILHDTLHRECILRKQILNPFESHDLCYTIDSFVKVIRFRNKSQQSD